jgi:hypothetical protein
MALRRSFYLHDLPAAGEYPPERWRKPDEVGLDPHLTRPMVLPIYKARVKQEKWADASTAHHALKALASTRRGDHEAVRRFVRDYGALQLEPSSGFPRHRRDHYPIGDLDESGRFHAAEELEWYYQYAELLRAVLDLTRQLRSRSEISREDLRRFREFLERVPADATHVAPLGTGLFALVAKLSRGQTGETRLESERRVDEGQRTRARALVSGVVNWWMALGRVTPVVRWARGSRLPQVLWAGGLWAAIGSQLLLAVAEDRTDDDEPPHKRVRCSQCGRRIMRERHKENPICRKTDYPPGDLRWRQCHARRMRAARAVEERGRTR